jgi:hypothetical protein
MNYSPPSSIDMQIVHCFKQKHMNPWIKELQLKCKFRVETFNRVTRLALAKLPSYLDKKNRAKVFNES